MSIPLKIKVNDKTRIPRDAVNGDGLIMYPAPTALTTAGAGTLLAALLASGLLVRTGPGGAVADTIDTGANLDIAYPDMQVGDTLSLFYTNGVAFAITITAAAGVTLGTAANNNVIAANTGRLLILRKTGVATYVLYVI